MALRADTLGTEHPLMAQLHVDLGRVLHQRGDSAAEQFLRRGIELSPRGPTALNPSPEPRSMRREGRSRKAGSPPRCS
ncbi:MAG: tetratricopeptide repeat protein [Gemmatimonadales bacterium]